MTRKFLEDDLQMRVAQYLRLQHPHLLWFHPANERKTSRAAGARLKKKGVLAGVADIILFWDGKFGGIELKCGKNTTTPFQEYFGQKLESSGGKYAVCRSLDEVIAALDSWL